MKTNLLLKISISGKLFVKEQIKQKITAYLLKSIKKKK